MSSQIHDYRRHAIRWGHSFEVWETRDNGQTVNAIGWGLGIRRGHVIYSGDFKNRAAYKVAAVSYYTDPRDMFSVLLLLDVDFDEWVYLNQCTSQHRPLTVLQRLTFIGWLLWNS